MDEMLFISMAKLGAQRLREERLSRVLTPPTTCLAGWPAQGSHARSGSPHELPSSRPTALAALSGSLAIVVTLLIALAALSNWYNERIAAPPGEVYITELNAIDDSPQARVAQSAAPSATRR